jgi:hypothetical protein
MDNEGTNVRYKRQTCPQKQDIEMPPDVNSIKDLIVMAQSGKRYANIDNEMLWKISAQLIEIDEMIGMNKLKQSIFFHVIYYLLDLYIDDERDYLHTVIMGPPGSGKCLQKDTLVMMYDGSVSKVQDLKELDMIMGDDSKPRTILSTCSGTEMLYDICPEYSNDVSDRYGVNASHILSLWHKETGCIHDLPLQEYLKCPEMYMGFKTSVEFSENESLDIDPYILGFSICTFYKDQSNRINIVVKDDRIYNYIYSTVKDIATSFVSKYPACFSDNIGVLPDNFYLFNRKDLTRILSGINDAIGEIQETSSRLYFTNDAFFKRVKLICNILGIPYTCNISHLDFEIYDNVIASPIFSLTIPNVFTYLPSVKYDIEYKHYEGQRIIPYNIKVTEITNDVYYGFEIDGNGRFVLGNFTVTHNTTIAKIIGEMYKNMGILSVDGVFKIAKREDFVAEYLGQTAIKTKKLLTSCLGGVLFIDEVYALGPGKKDHDSFSKEAIDTLNVFLSEHSDSFCCIIAGYEEDIKNCFFSINQGLERRFQWIHRIEDYSIEELAQMFIKLVTDIRWKRDESLTIENITGVLQKNKTLFKSFGGDIENLITKCKMAHAKRIINTLNPEKHTITLTDLKLAIELMKPNSLKKDEQDDRFSYMMYM